MLARLSLVLLLVAPPALALERLFVVGEARSMKDGELRYREYHHCSEDRSNCEVLYKDTEGALFARKRIDYSQSIYCINEFISPVIQCLIAKVFDSPFSYYVAHYCWDSFLRNP